MADILIDVESTPTTPSAGTAYIFVDNVTKKATSKNDAGTVDTLADTVSINTSTVSAAYATDTYIAGSGITMAPGAPKIGSQYYFTCDITKTAAGVATPTFNVRFGTAGTTADASILSYTFGVGTAVADTAIVELWGHFFQVGAATGAFRATMRITHLLAATGFTTSGAAGSAVIINAGSTFNSTVANSILGVSFNGGASFSGTTQVAQARMLFV